MLQRMKHMPRAARVMTPFPYSLDASADLAAASAMMKEQGFRHIPVKRGDEVLGVVSQRDVWRAHTEGQTDIDMGTLVGTSPYIVEWNAPLDVLARTMAERKLGSAVVVRNGRLAGIVTTTDICSYLAELLELQFGEPSDGGGDEVA